LRNKIPVCRIPALEKKSLSRGSAPRLTNWRAMLANLRGIIWVGEVIGCVRLGSRLLLTTQEALEARFAGLDSLRFRILETPRRSRESEGARASLESAGAVLNVLLLLSQLQDFTESYCSGAAVR